MSNEFVLTRLRSNTATANGTRAATAHGRGARPHKVEYRDRMRSQSRRDETLLTVEFILRKMDAASPLVPQGRHFGAMVVSSLRDARAPRLKALYINSAGQRPADRVASVKTSPERAQSTISPLRGFAGFASRSIGRCPILMMMPLQGI